MKALLLSVPAILAAGAAVAHPATVPHVHTSDGSAAAWVGLALSLMAVAAAFGRNSLSQWWNRRK